jgi:hypothetical protein
MTTNRSRVFDDLWHNLRGAPETDPEIRKMVDEMASGRWTTEQVATVSEMIFRVRVCVGDLGAGVKIPDGYPQVVGGPEFCETDEGLDLRDDWERLVEENKALRAEALLLKRTLAGIDSLLCPSCVNRIAIASFGPKAPSGEALSQVIIP